MTNEPYTLPPRMIWLGQALQPLVVRLDTLMQQPPPPSPGIYSFGDLATHLGHMANVAARAQQRVETLSRAVLENDTVNENAVHRAVDRFEAQLNEWQDVYAAIQGLVLPDASNTIRNLLAGALLHTLREVRAWLADLVELLLDIDSAIRKRGLPTSGHVEITLALILTAAPQLAELTRLVESLYTAYEPGTALQPNRRNGLGFWGAVGAVVLGVGIGDALFGDDEDY
jgi:hypothetical protein